MPQHPAELSCALPETAAKFRRDASPRELPERQFLPNLPERRLLSKMDRERQQRAAVSQPVTTPSEAEVKKLDDEHDAEIQQLNKMRTALKEAKVKGYQLFKPDTLKAKYAELLKNQSHTQTE